MIIGRETIFDFGFSILKRRLSGHGSGHRGSRIALTRYDFDPNDRSGPTPVDQVASCVGLPPSRIGIRGDFDGQRISPDFEGVAATS